MRNLITLSAWVFLYGIFSILSGCFPFSDSEKEFHPGYIDITAPTVGSGPTFSGLSESTMTVSWGEAEDNSTSTWRLQYKLVRSLDSTLIDTVEEADALTAEMDWTTGTLSKAITGLASGTVYYYAILVRDLNHNTSLYPVTGQITVADSPTSLSATAGPGLNDLQWTASVGAASYNLYWSISSGVTKSDNKITGVTSTYTHTSLTPGTTYYYAVSTVTSAGESSLSNETSSIANWKNAKQIGSRGARSQMEGAATATDTADSSYIVGYTLGDYDGITRTGYRDAYITKFNSAGTKQWSKLLGVSGKQTYAIGVATDSSNNVYMGGHTTGGLDGNTLAGTQDLFLTKYDSSGTKQWTSQFGQTGGHVTTMGTTVDSSDNIFVVGTTTAGLGGNTQTGTIDFFVAKYNSSGSRQWVRQLGVAAANTYGQAVATDSSNNVFVGGYVNGGLDGNSLTGTNDFFITKYNSSGVKQWTKQLGIAAKQTVAYGLSVDSADSIYIGGNTTGGLDGNSLTGLEDFFITQYNSAGTKQWTKQLGVAAKYTGGYSLANDSANNVYITGHTTGGLDGNTLTGQYDIFTTKYNSAGTKQWTKQLGVSSSQSHGMGVSIDSTDNVYVSGRTVGNLDGNTITGSQDGTLTKYDSTGTKLFTKLVGSNGGEAFFEADAVARDSSNNIYVAGHVDGSFEGTALTGTIDAILIKYNYYGVRQWVRYLGVANSQVAINALTTDPSGNVYVTGNTDGGIDGNPQTGSSDMFIAKYDSSGNRLWSNQLGVATKITGGIGIVRDSSGNLYVSGTTQGGLDGNSLTGFIDTFLTKYNSSGAKQWTRQFGLATKVVAAMHAAIDSTGNIYLGGYTNGGVDGNPLTGTLDGILVKMDSTGTKQWTKQYGAAGVNTWGYDMTIDSADGIYMTGMTEGGIDGNTLSGDEDFFLIKYNTAGVKQFTRQLGAQAFSYTEAYGVSSDSSNNIYVVGGTFGNLDGNTKVGTQDMFMTKYDSSGTKQWTRQYGVTSQTVVANKVCTDSTDGVYMVGKTEGGLDGNTMGGLQDLFITKVSTSGVKQ